MKKQDGSTGVPIKGACLDMSKLGYTRVSEEKNTRKERRWGGGETPSPDCQTFIAGSANGSTSMMDTPTLSSAHATLNRPLDRRRHAGPIPFVCVCDGVGGKNRTRWNN